MNRLRIQITCFAVALLALLAAFPAAAQCDNGREGVLSDTFLGSSAVEWRMLVEHRAVTLTVSAPCGLVIDRTYEEGKSPSFSLREIPADPDGVYTWQLRIAPHVDPEVEKMLMSARESGDDQTIEYELRQKGALPEGPFLQTGSFSVVNGAIVPQDEEERQSSKLTAGVRPAASADNCPHTQAQPAVQTARLSSIAPAVDRGGSTRPPALAAADTPRRITGEDVVFNDDMIVVGSLCVGFDCVSGEVFSFDTIRLKENNLRIKFEDTSGGSFPSRDWEIEANSSTNGGQSHFRINDVDGARSPFTIEAAAPSHSLYVDNSGRIGRKTANPILELHMVDGDTPAIRLEQDTSSGFGAQVWDIAGNETNFFVRDATNGSTLPFRIFPGSSSSSLVVRNGNVGMGTTSPSEKLDIHNAGVTRIQLSNTTAATDWNFANDGNGDFAISRVGSGGNDFEIEQDGDIGNCGNPDNDFVISVGPGCAATPRSWINAGDTQFSTSSSRTFKENIKPVKVESILDKLREVPVYEYDFVDGPKDRIGLMAEDFFKVFGRGSEKELSGHDMQIALWMAVQELIAKNDELSEQNRSLREAVEGLQSKLD